MSDLTPDELAFLQAARDLARTGQTDALTAPVESGLPVNLTGGQGDSRVNDRSAREIAVYFALDEMQRLLPSQQRQAPAAHRETHQERTTA